MLISNGIQDKYLRLIETKSFKVNRIKLFNSNPRAVFSQDGSLIISGAYSDLNIFNSKNRKTIKIIKNANLEEFGLGLIDLACCTNKGRYFSTLSDQEVLKIWDLNTFKQVREFSNAGSLQNEFSQGGKYFTMKDGLFLTSPWKKIMTFKKDDYYVAFSPDSRFIAVTDRNKITIYDLKSLKIVASLKKGDNKDIDDIAYSPDGKYLAAGSEDMIYIWSLKTN